MNTEAGDKRRLIGNTVATGVAQFASLALAFVLAPLLIREFGVREYGLYVLVLSIGTFATLLDFGMGAALEKLLAEHLASRRTHEAGQLFSTVLLAYTGIGVLAMLLYAVLAWRAGHLFHIAPSEVRLLRDLLLVSGAIALATWPLSTGLRVLGGLQRYADAARVALGVTVTSALAAAYVLATHRSPVTLAALMGGVTVLGGIANLVVALARLRSTGVKPAAPARTAFAKVLDFSWAVFVLQLAVQLIYHHTDRLLLGLFLGVVSVTLYEGPARLVALVVQLVGLSNSALMPFASQLDATGRSGTLSALLLRGSRYVTAFIAPIATMIVVLARPLLTTWLGPEFAVAVVPTMLLVGVQIVLASATVGHTLVVGTGKLKGRLPYIIFQTLANVALSVVLS